MWRIKGRAASNIWWWFQWATGEIEFWSYNEDTRYTKLQEIAGSKNSSTKPNHANWVANRSDEHRRKQQPPGEYCKFQQHGTIAQ